MPVLVVQLVGGRTFHVHNMERRHLEDLEERIRVLQLRKGAHLVMVQPPTNVAPGVSFFAHQVIGLQLIEGDHEEPPAGG